MRILEKIGFSATEPGRPLRRRALLRRGARRDRPRCASGASWCCPGVPRELAGRQARDRSRCSSSRGRRLGFRATVVPLDADGAPLVSADVRDALGVKSGDRVSVTPLPVSATGAFEAMSEVLRSVSPADPSDEIGRFPVCGRSARSTRRSTRARARVPGVARRRLRSARRRAAPLPRPRASAPRRARAADRARSRQGALGRARRGGAARREGRRHARRRHALRRADRGGRGRARRLPPARRARGARARSTSRRTSRTATSCRRSRRATASCSSRATSRRRVGDWMSRAVARGRPAARRARARAGPRRDRAARWRCTRDVDGVLFTGSWSVGRALARRRSTSPASCSRSRWAARTR